MRRSGESEPIETSEGLTQEERREKKKRTAKTVGALALFGLVVGTGLGGVTTLNHLRGSYNGDDDTTYSTQSGQLGVEMIKTPIDASCGDTVFITRVENASTEVRWKDGLFNKSRKVEVDADVITSFCNKEVDVKTIVDHDNKTYDMYFDEGDMYLKTEIDSSNGNSEENENTGFFVKYSGSGTTIPDNLLESAIEGSEILKKLPLTNAHHVVQSAKDSEILELTLWKAETDVAAKCGPIVAKETEDVRYQAIADKRKAIIASAAPGFEEYDVRVFVGEQSRENPDAEVHYSVVYDGGKDAFDLKTSNDMAVASGEVGECTPTSDMKVVDGRQG